MTVGNAGILVPRSVSVTSLKPEMQDDTISIDGWIVLTLGTCRCVRILHPSEILLLPPFSNISALSYTIAFNLNT